MSLSLIANEVAVCTKCPLCKTRTNTVPGQGNPNASVMLIGEAPGYNEDKQGLPFVGVAGGELTHLLEIAGLKREEVFITNTVKCRAVEANRNRAPTREERLACRDYLERQIEIVRPRIIVLMGNSALKNFFPERELGNSHGRIFFGGKYVFFITCHPMYALYSKERKGMVEVDFELLKRYLWR